MRDWLVNAILNNCCRILPYSWCCFVAGWLLIDFEGGVRSYRKALHRIGGEL